MVSNAPTSDPFQYNISFPIALSLVKVGRNSGKKKEKENESHMIIQNEEAGEPHSLPNIEISR